ncbi:MAG: hypothetical protein HY319_16380 [Armatimonadetes bacterium]|nr:hypothetical protein [Armatimonadota bacterium]
MTWLTNFFSQGALWSWYFTIAQTPWALAVYPFFTPSDVLTFLFTCYITGWIGRSLEASWGTRKLGIIALCMSLGMALSLKLGAHMLGGQTMMVGLQLPMTGLFVMWAMLNPTATVLFMFVIPVQARWLGYLDLAFLYFSHGPVLGFFAILCPLLGWLYVHKTRYLGRQLWPGPVRAVVVAPARERRSWNPFANYRRARLKKSLRAIEGGGTGRTPRPRVIRTEEPSEREREIDRILDKIRDEGMSSLTEEERARLDAQSERLRYSS